MNKVGLEYAKISEYLDVTSINRCLYIPRLHFVPKPVALCVRMSDVQDYLLNIDNNKSGATGIAQATAASMSHDWCPHNRLIVS